MLARGGTLVSYGTASTKDVAGNPRAAVAKLIGRLLLWNALPNGRHASFFNLWAGRRRNTTRFQTRSARTSGTSSGSSRRRDHAADRRALPADPAAEALRFAEAGGHAGKVVILLGAAAVRAAVGVSRRACRR